MSMKLSVVETVYLAKQHSSYVVVIQALQQEGAMSPFRGGHIVILFVLRLMREKKRVYRS